MDADDMRIALLRAMGDTLALDLAVAPLLVVAGDDGLAAKHALLNLAMGLIMRRRDLRPDEGAEALESIRALTSAGSSLIVIETDGWDEGELVRALRHVAEHAASETVIALVATSGGGEDAEAAGRHAIMEGLGHHHALYRTVVLAEGREAARIPVVGEVGNISTRIGEMRVEVFVETPYQHDVKVDVRAVPGQTDDDLASAIDGVDVVAIQARDDGDRLWCTTRDLHAIERMPA